MERRDVLKSKNAIKEAYVQLSLIKPTSKITIQEIITKANISRGTFYAHFADIYALQADIEEELISQWKSIVNTDRISNITTDPYDVLIGFYQFFQNTANMMRPLSDGGFNSLHFYKLKSMLVDVLYSKNGTNKERKTSQYTTAICIAGIIVDTCYDMVCNPDSPIYENPEATARQVSRFISGGSAAIRNKL